MNIAQIEDNLQKLQKNLNEKKFIYDLLLAYGIPKNTITRLQKGGLNLAKAEGEVYLKKKLFYKVSEDQDLHELIDDLKKDDKLIRHNPRFLIVTDFKTLLAVDRKTSDSLDIPILDISKHFDFFLPWAGMEKAQHQSENPADVKAAEKMAKLYNEIKKNNISKKPKEIHNLNVFLSRLLFCFFAEDTGIFEKGQFTNSIGSHTQQDGSDLHTYLDKLFEVMNTEVKKRRKLPAYLEAFPYVNGGLYKNKHAAPFFTRISRKIILECGTLNWSAINPDIFGSMIQVVVRDTKDDDNTKHYTSVPNIMKVIEPLFLNDLYEEFESAKGNTKKLNALLHRIWKIKIFDPACGSGNFLVIAYKELRRLEMKIFKELNSMTFSNISLNNFYGIELDDFAHEIAILSLWLTEHQMNQEFFKEFGRTRPALPLKEAGNIVHGNATRVDWEEVCPKKEGDEIYIMGNPPYLGFSLQDQKQKEDMALFFNGTTKLDYIACWFLKGADFIQNCNAQCAFVSTNSICQGEQVAMLWPSLLAKNLEIGFAYTSFKWVNNARANAAVIVIIVGIRNRDVKSQKVLFTGNRKLLVSNINVYLSQANNIIIEKRNSPLSAFKEIVLGNMAKDGGNLFLTNEERDDLILKYPSSSSYIRKAMGSHEFINDISQFCLWINKQTYSHALEIPIIKDRIEAVARMRNESVKNATKEFSEMPYRFVEVRNQETDALIVPRVSSERRPYIPIGFIKSGTIIKDSAYGIYDANLSLFGILSSKMHMAWIRSVAGRLKSDYRYSSALCYNTFPFPPISQAQKQELEKNAHYILEERERHSEKTLAQLYDPDKMPQGLRDAHHQLDLAVERCYRSKPFESDEERLEHLFKLYEQMVSEEKERNGELNFEPVKSKKKKIKYA